MNISLGNRVSEGKWTQIISSMYTKYVFGSATFDTFDSLAVCKKSDLSALFVHKGLRNEPIE